jgi:hypothetical protein
VTLAQFERLLDRPTPTNGRLEYQGRLVRNVCLIHCVGSRQIEGVHPPGPNGRINTHCSRVCCTAALHAAVEVRRRFPEVNVFDLHQDIRTYGRGQEDCYTEASRRGVIFLRYAGDQPPVVSAASSGDGLGANGPRQGSADFRRIVGGSGRSGRAGHRHGSPRQRAPDRSVETGPERRRFLAGSPSETAARRDGGGRDFPGRYLPGPDGYSGKLCRGLGGGRQGRLAARPRNDRAESVPRAGGPGPLSRPREMRRGVRVPAGDPTGSPRNGTGGP